MADPRSPAPRLVVGHDDPETVRSWLSPGACDDVSLGESPLVRVGRGVVADSLPYASGLQRGTLLVAPMVALPLDGPVKALSVAARALRAQTADPGAVVVPLPFGGAPPPINALVAVAEAHLVPGAELSRVRWVEADAIWWTEDTHVTRLPIDVSSPTAGRRGASLLTATRGFESSTAAGQWIVDVAQGCVESSPEEWSTVLAVHYIQTVAGRLRRLR